MQKLKFFDLFWIALIVSYDNIDYLEREFFESE